MATELGINIKQYLDYKKQNKNNVVGEKRM